MTFRKILTLALFLLAPIVLLAEKANTVLIHPGEVIYARFAQKGKHLKLISATKQKDDQAQVVFTIEPKREHVAAVLKVENKFSAYLIYKADLRLVSEDLHTPVEVAPVVGGKMAVEKLGFLVGVVVLSGFELQP